MEGKEHFSRFFIEKPTEKEVGTDEEVEEFGFSYTLLAEEEPKQATKRSSLTGPPKGGVPKAPPATPKKAAPAAPAKGKKK